MRLHARYKPERIKKMKEDMDMPIIKKDGMRTKKKKDIQLKKCKTCDHKRWKGDGWCYMFIMLMIGCTQYKPRKEEEGSL